MFFDAFIYLVTRCAESQKKQYSKYCNIYIYIYIYISIQQFNTKHCNKSQNTVKYHNIDRNKYKLNI